MPIFEQLEPRILLSADIIPLPADTDSSPLLEPQDDVPSPEQPLASEPNTTTALDQEPSQSTESSNQDEQTDSSDATDQEEGTPLQADLDQETTKEIIFINDDLEGFDELTSDLTENSNTQVIILDSTKDGIDQIGSALEDQTDKTSLQFFTHGNTATVKIGSTWLSRANLSEHQDSVASWGNSLSEEGDILFYACDLAKTPEGESFINDIAELTGADVAASSDLTGHSSNSGDWILEYETGEIETVVPVSPELQNDWLHILVEETIADNFDSGAYSGSTGTIDWGEDGEGVHNIWIEFGDDDDSSTGDVQITHDGSLLIKPAASYETERGISRVVDLSDAASAFLSFDMDDYFGGTVSVEIQKDGGDWVTLYDDEIVWDTDATRLQYDISDYTSSATEIRFVSAGTNHDGLSNGSPSLSYFKVDNLNIDYTTDTWSTALIFSTDKDVTEGGQTGIEDWGETDLIGLNNSALTLGDTTAGTFSMVAEFSETFAEDADIGSLHYVTTKMDIGGFELNVGDLLFSADGLHIDDPEHPELSSFYGVADSEQDIIHFSPTNVGDYSSGTFTLFLDEITDDEINSFTLVESEVTVGDRTLNAGDILITHDGNDNNIYHLIKTETTIDGQPAYSYSSPDILLDGDDDGIKIDEKITGLDLVERTVTIGNTTLQEGTLLLSVEDNIKEGDWPSALFVNDNDIFALDVTTTSSPDNFGEASASMFFDGSDVAFNSDQEEFDALSLTVQADIPEPTFTGAFFNAGENTITLTGTNLDYISGTGINVKDQLDWENIVWDVNGDGETTSNITFTVLNTPIVLVSSTEMVIHLTAAKTNEIIATPGYAEDGGPDTIIITPGFSINSEGEAATTDGFNSEIITTTGPVGVDFERNESNLNENTDTSAGGVVVGTLSTIDADADDTHTYVKTGGDDFDNFSIVGNELILNDGILDYERQSSYEVTIQVTDSSGQTAEETLTIAVNDINEAPTIINNNLTIVEDGGPITLTTANLSASDPETTDSGSLEFTVSNLNGGYFTHVDTGATNTFTQAEISLGKISFVDDSDETAPTYDITVSDGVNTTTSTADTDLIETNDAPQVITNSLTLKEGEWVTVTASDLEIDDPDTDASELDFTVTSVTGGHFQLASNPGLDLENEITEFTLEQINNGDIEFQQIGDAAIPGYTLTLIDGSHTIYSDGDIDYTPVNDIPVLEQNYVPIDQSSNLQITTSHLLVRDPDASAANLTYDITNLSNSYFRVNGSVDTTFTQAEVNAGVVIYYQDGSASAPSFDFEVTDDEGASTGAITANIDFNPTFGDIPDFDKSGFTVSEGETVTLNSSEFHTIDGDTSDDNIRYTITSYNGGYFELDSNQGHVIETFTQADINAGEINFVDDGDEIAPSFTASVSDGISTGIPPSSGYSINFTRINDAPVIENNNLTITEGETTIPLTSTNLSVDDVDSDSTSFTYNITAVSGGIFALSGTTAEITSFTQAQLDAGVVFIHDGSENEPTYTVTVSDNDPLDPQESDSQSADITFINTNDAPVLTNNSFTVVEGEDVTLQPSDIAAEDIDGVEANLRFHVTALGGHFAYDTAPATSIGSFTQGEILAGSVLFVHDGGEDTPTYMISVEDDYTPSISTEAVPGTVIVTPVNDAPTITNSATSQNYSEDDSSFFLSGISIGDVDGGSTYKVTLELSQQLAGSLSENSIGDASSEFTEGVLTVTGDDIEEVNSVLAATQFIPTADYYGDVTITINASQGADSADSTTRTLHGTPVNDAPTITNSAISQTYWEDNPVTLSGISIGDVDESTPTFDHEVTLELSNLGAGSLSENSIGDANSEFLNGILTVTGNDIGEINSVLAATKFIPTDNYNGHVTISINASDGIPSTSTSRSLHGIAINDAPLATNLNQSGNYTEDMEFELQDIVVSDVDQDEEVTATLKLDSPDNGSLTTERGGDFDPTTGTWTITADVASVNSALADVKFKPATDSFSDTSIEVTIEDGKEDGITPLGGTISLTGTAVADAPVVSNAETLNLTPTEPIYITTNSADGSEITHFQITEITNGELYLSDGITPVSENNYFITVSDGSAGLIFTPSSANSGSFKAIGSQDGTTISPTSTSATSTITIIEAQEPAPVVTVEPNSDRITTDTGGGNSEALKEPTEEIINELVEEPSELDETLDLAAGQDVGTEDAEAKNDDSSSTKESEAGANEQESETENTGEDNVDTTLSYVNAKKISQTAADTTLSIAAAFDNLSFDLSFAQTTVSSFSFSSSTSQTMMSESASLETTSDGEHSFVSTDYDLLDLEYRDRSFEEYQSVRKSLESFREQTEQEASIEKTVVGSAIAASTGLSAGYVIWLLRSGALLSSILSSLPAWQLADPLAVLAGAKGEEEDEDDSIESIIEKGTNQPTADENTLGTQKDSLAD